MASSIKKEKTEEYAKQFLNNHMKRLMRKIIREEVTLAIQQEIAKGMKFI